MQARQRPMGASASEQVELFAASLDDRIQTEIGLESIEREVVAVEKSAEVVPLDHVPVVALERVVQERRPLELVTDELGALRCNDQEPDHAVVLRDAGMAAKHRFAEHRSPLDLEQERQPAAAVPRAI